MNKLRCWCGHLRRCGPQGIWVPEPKEWWGHVGGGKHCRLLSREWGCTFPWRKRGLLPHLSSSSFTFHDCSFQIQQVLGIAISFWGCFEFPSFSGLDKDLRAKFGEAASRYLRQTPTALTPNTWACEPQANLCWWTCYHFTDQSTWRRRHLGNYKWVASTNSGGACLLCSLRPPSSLTGHCF